MGVRRRGRVEFWFAEPLVGAGGAVVQYWAVSKSAGRTKTFAGVAVIRFGADGRVVEQRDYWSLHPGAAAPPSGWGPVAAHGRRG